MNYIASLRILMRKRYFEILTVCLAVLVLGSCVKDKDNEDLSPACAITSFSVGSITSYVTTTNAAGQAAVSKRTVSGSDIYFSIDQKAGTITNVYPLPNWITLTKVVPKFTSQGNVYVEAGGNLWSITSGTDSIDVSSPCSLLCISTDGNYSKRYTLTINKNTEVSDTILWSRLSAADLQLSGSHRALVLPAVYKDRQNADSVVYRMFVFSNDSEGKPQVTSSTDRSQGTTWTAPETLTGAEGTIDYQSVVVHKGRLYAIDENGGLYTSTEHDKGIVWAKVTDSPFVRLLGSDGLYLYGFDGTDILGTVDFSEWEVSGSADVDQLPTSSLYSYYFTSHTNDSLTIAMMGGISSGNSVNGVSWYKITSAEPFYNAPWSYMQVSGGNAYGCPRLEELSVVNYAGYLYAMGRRRVAGDTYKFEGFYCSEDNGIAWHLQSAKWRLPADLDAVNGPASTLLVGNQLYVVQSGGGVWRGTIK